MSNANAYFCIAPGLYILLPSLYLTCKLSWLLLCSTKAASHTTHVHLLQCCSWTVLIVCSLLTRNGNPDYPDVLSKLVGCFCTRQRDHTLPGSGNNVPCQVMFHHFRKKRENICSRYNAIKESGFISFSVLLQF